MKLTLAAGLLLVLCACNNNKTATTENDTTADTFAEAKTDTLAPAHDAINYDSVITLHFERDSITTSATGYEDGSGKQITFLIEVTRGKKIKAEVKPLDTAGNVRITQIILPSGKMDGPFGQAMEYDATERGIYKLLAGPNMMAGDVWKGAFKLQITVK